MKIEDSSLNRGVSPLIRKLNVRPSGQMMDVTASDFDLSFLELLNTLQVPTVTAMLTEEMPVAGGGNADKVKEKSASNVISLPAKTAVSQNSALNAEDDVNSPDWDDEMTLLRDELSVLDIQYLKQEIIPALPILMGTVPFEQVFTVQPDGEIGYKSFELSPQLSELIQKGYKSGSPIRVELDAQSALVLKFRNGQVSAEFVSLNKNAPFVMQHELDDLRNRLLAHNLPVGQLEAKQQQSQRQKHQQEEVPEPSDSER